MKRSEILANRKIVVEFLQQPERKKARGALDKGNGERCCLGHMCYVLNLPSQRLDGETVMYCGKIGYAPVELLHKLGLYDTNGVTKSLAHIVFGSTSLAELNDTTDWTPQEIGAYLETVIGGGVDTPWKPLEAYPE